jgi:very-short-patch-repair endonuclease
MRNLPAVDAVMGDQARASLAPEPADRRIAELAGRQHGVVSHRQLRAIGIGPRAIAHRLQQGRLHSVHRGVYAVGHAALTIEGRWIAAVISFGPRTVLSHRAAAALLEIRNPFGPEVTVPTWRRRRSGIVVHQLPLSRDEIMVVKGIPVTTVARTLLDLAAVLRRSDVERAVNAAEVRRPREALQLGALVERYPSRHGIRIARAIAAELSPGVIRSELEARFRGFVRSYRLPRPEFNVSLLVGGDWLECDCVWRAQRQIVELDGRAVHSTATAFERDRARDRVLQVAGWRVIRVTWRHLRDQPEVLASDLRKLLVG